MSARAAAASVQTDPAAEDASLQQGLIELIPHLRAFARSLTLDPTSADDLVQETLLKALNARASFVPGTNLKAWAFTILRNQFYSERRNARRQTPWDDEDAAFSQSAPSNPDAVIALGELRRALSRLPAKLREAVILVGAGGFSCKEAAAICGCETGTIKSRVNRARRRLEDELASGAAKPEPGDAPAHQAMDAILDDMRRLAGTDG